MVAPELAVKIIFLVIASITAFYGAVHVTFYKLRLPGFERWALNLGVILLVVSAVVSVLGIVF